MSKLSRKIISRIETFCLFHPCSDEIRGEFRCRWDYYFTDPVIYLFHENAWSKGIPCFQVQLLKYIFETINSENYIILESYGRSLLTDLDGHIERDLMKQLHFYFELSRKNLK